MQSLERISWRLLSTPARTMTGDRESDSHIGWGSSKGSNLTCFAL
jgi:hypothetical protein